MIFRVARHTNDLEKVTSFYTSILNLELLGYFKNHHNYNGVFIGRKNSDWHLEFTASEEQTNHHFDEDDILVFYPLNESEYADILQKISEHNITIHSSKNPYWNVNGIMIKDPDGYNIIVSNMKSKK